MARWIWYFWIYSLLGYGIEKLFAAVTRAEHQVRKCFLLLPMCPVYGLGMAAVLALPETIRQGPWVILLGGLAATAVEYVVHWAYEWFLGVQFWDYTRVRGNLHGRVCLPFTAAWGFLSAAAVWFVQPLVSTMAERVPPELTYLCLLVFTADSVCTGYFLRATGDIDRLRAAGRTVRNG